MDQNQNIAEITHEVLFLDCGVLGAEYNFSGARPTAITKYLDAVAYKVGYHIQTRCTPKLNDDVYSKIIKNEKYTLFDFAVKCNSEAYKELRKSQSIFSSLCRSIPDDVDVVEVKLTKRKKQSNEYQGFDAPLTEEEMRKLSRDYKDDFSKFTISQNSITKDSVDLLSDKFIKKEVFAKTEKRQIDSNMMYDSIVSFYYDAIMR